MESALQAALSSGAQPKAPYRRAHGAAREALKEETGAPPTRTAVDAISPLPKQRIAALASPILHLISDMQFYSVMGASTQVIVVDIDSPVSVAFIAATESRVSSVLLWDGSASTFAGLLTVTDYIRVLLHCHAEGSSASDSIVGHSIRELVTKDWLKSTAPAASNFVWGTPNLTVLDCLGAMIQHKVNRLPILASKAFEEEQIPDDLPMGVQSGSAAAASPAPCPAPPTSYSVVSVVTFPQLLAHIGRVLLSSDAGAAGEESLYDVPLKALGVGRHITSLQTGAIPHITLENTVSDALGVMIEQNVHAVCIRGPNGGIADVVTRSDVLRMESGGAYDVTLPLSEALSWRPAQASAVVCSVNDSFGDVLAHFVNTWVKEMFVVDPETDEVLGQLSMKELLQFLFDTMREADGASA